MVTLKPTLGPELGKQIGYTGGVGRLIATFGDSKEIATAGTQTFDIPIVYVERTVENIKFTTAGIQDGGIGNTAPFYNEKTKRFEFDPFVVYDADENGFNDGCQGYLKYGQYGATLQFKPTKIDEVLNLLLKTSGYDLTEQNTPDFIGLSFNDSTVMLKTEGGSFEVFAEIQNVYSDAKNDDHKNIDHSGKLTDSEISKQRISYKVRVMSRKVGVNENIPYAIDVQGVAGEIGSKVYYSDKAYRIVNGIQYA